MKAEELMIGDWVTMVADAKRFPKNVVNETILCKVVGLDKYKTEGVRVANNFEFMDEDPYKLSPIYLTPKILEKNGFRIIFEGELHTTYFQDIDGFAVEIKIDCIVFTKLSMSNGLGYRVATECKYVHQLQHALRLCGINKEIVL